jgi:hypothetical protein
VNLGAKKTNGIHAAPDGPPAGRSPQGSNVISPALAG